VGFCTVDGRKVENVISQTACKNIWGARWTAASSTGVPAVVGMLCLAVPSCFLLLGIGMITDNLLEYRRQKKIDAENKLRDEATLGLQSGVAKVGIMNWATKGFQLFKSSPAGDASPRPSSATRAQSVIMRDTMKVNTWLRMQVSICTHPSL
jgi:hypothetical protein